MITIVDEATRPDNWDDSIGGFASKTLFHEACWLDHIQDFNPGASIRYATLMNEGEVVGKFCGLLKKKFLIPIMGSPLGGTGTNYMGPVIDESTPYVEVLEALVKHYKGQGVRHFEFSHPWLEAPVMSAAGYDVHPSVTHVCELSGDEESLWMSLKGPCRNRVRKAQKSGVTVEVAEDDSIASEFWNFLKAVYEKQQLAVPFGPDRPTSLLKHLQPAGRILPLRVSLDGKTIAAGLFPFDERCIYFWGAAASPEAYKHCPNEIMHWEVMRLARERRIGTYNMCGGQSQFKDKFGGEDIPYIHFSRSSNAALKQGRAFYSWSHYAWLKAKGKVTRALGRSGMSSPEAP